MRHANRSQKKTGEPYTKVRHSNKPLEQGFQSDIA